MLSFEGSCEHADSLSTRLVCKPSVVFHLFCFWIPTPTSLKLADGVCFFKECLKCGAIWEVHHMAHEAEAAGDLETKLQSAQVE